MDPGQRLSTYSYFEAGSLHGGDSSQADGQRRMESIQGYVQPELDRVQGQLGEGPPDIYASTHTNGYCFSNYSLLADLLTCSDLLHCCDAG